MEANKEGMVVLLEQPEDLQSTPKKKLREATSKTKEEQKEKSIHNLQVEGTL